jgi:hypothetical protein
MLDRNEQVGRIVAAWDQRTAEKGLIPGDPATSQMLAEVALTALECGEPHPDRRDVRCTQLPHGNGHLFHRNSGLGIEWWTSGDTTQTVHDVLGPIQLGQSPAVADASGPVSCPECRWIGQDGRAHDQLIGGRLRCAHCGHEWNGPESRPSSWCRAKHPHFDMYCDTHHPLNTRRHGSSIYGFQWTDPQDPAESDKRGRYHTLPPCEDDTDDATLHDADATLCGAKHPRYGWCCDRDAHRVFRGDNSTWHRDTGREGYWCSKDDVLGPPDVQPAVTAVDDADRAVYRDLLPLLGPVATFLDRMGKRYREGNPRMTSELCRTAEDHRDHLHKVIDTLQEVVTSDE